MDRHYTQNYTPPHLIFVLHFMHLVYSVTNTNYLRINKSVSQVPT